MQNPTRVFVLGVLCITLSGCIHTRQGAGDKLWSKDRLRFVVDSRHYKPGPILSESTGIMIGEEWSVVTFAVPHQEIDSGGKHQFLHIAGENYDNAFSSIDGSDLLIHHLVGNVMERQFMLFDPKSGKDMEPLRNGTLTV